MLYLTMFWEFFKAGLFAVGGGLATLPFLYDIAEKFHWLDAAMLPDMVAVGESTPGPIGINIATFAGFSEGGIPGALMTTLGIITPSIIIISIIYGFLDKYQQNKYVQRALSGVRPASVALITSAALSITFSSLLDTTLYVAAHNFDTLKLVIFALLTISVFKFKKIHPTVFIAVAAVLGILFKL